jgi:hypothetical protein
MTRPVKDETERTRRRRLLAVMRQVSQEAGERWPRYRARNLRAVNAFYERRLAELIQGAYR